jgi:hypothetical protein
MTKFIVEIFYTLAEALPFKQESKDYFLVRLDCDKTFYVFENIDYYWKFVRNSKWKEDKRMFHEIIVDKHKIFIDIDLKKEEYPEATEDCMMLAILELYTIIKETLYELYDIVYHSKDFILCQTKYDDKFSYHIILDKYYSQSHIETKNFMTCVFNNIPEYSILKNKGVIDMQQYRTNGSLRVIGSFKIKYKYKLLFGEIETFEKFEQYSDTLLTNIKNCKPLPILVRETSQSHPSQFKHIDISYDYDEHISTAVNILNIDYSFECNLAESRIVEKNGKVYVCVTLIPPKPYKCLVCDVSHDSMNPYLINNNSSVSFVCRRAPSHGKTFPDDRKQLIKF